MFKSEKKESWQISSRSRRATESSNDDVAELARQGYKQEFMREFGNLSTFSFAFSIMGLVSSVAITFSTPLGLGGPASVIWCWLIGSILNCAVTASIAELISAYPTNGALYTASAKLVTPEWRPFVGFLIGWMNVLGNIAGAASTEFGLSQIIWAGVALGKGDGYEASSGQTVGLFVGLLCMHGIFNSMKTKQLAFVTQFFVFINLAITWVVIIALLAKVGAKNLNSASYAFTSIQNNSGWSSNGFAFLLGLLSVQWTMTGYDAVGHISEEVKRASIAAPVALCYAVLSTGVFGWILNIAVVLASGTDIEALYEYSDNLFLAVLAWRLGTAGALVIWSFICLVAVFTLQTGLQANARSVFALSRDHGMPDWGFFAKLNPVTKTPLNCVWLVVLVSVALGCLDFASYVAVEAIFSLATVALDLSYCLPIFFKLLFHDKEGVEFQPGPFSMEGTWYGPIVNWIAVVWIVFECVILSMPEVYPVTATNMNYAGPITLGVMILAFAWYLVYGHRFYHGPSGNLEHSTLGIQDSLETKEV